jgi:peptidoglycan DL-endopeptidase LytF
MSRRDTIIIAVLVNAALLMILFATAVRSGDPKEDLKSADLAVETSAHSPGKKYSVQDEFLNEYVTSIPALTEKGTGNEHFFMFEETIAVSPSAPEAVEKPVAQGTPSLSSEATKAKTETTYVQITVKKGDVLEKLAKANQTSVSEIMKANNLNSSQLKIGQVLKIPLTKGCSAALPALSLADGDFYIVKEGDSPWLIASRNKINLEELLRLNGLDEQKAKRLRPGDKLRIR